MNVSEDVPISTYTVKKDKICPSETVGNPLQDCMAPPQSRSPQTERHRTAGADT